MDLGIRGKWAIVNGGSAGMGRASALALAREGVNLVVSARGEERLLRACRQIEDETGANVTPVAADHSTAEGRARILAACPSPDILVGTCSPPPVTGDYATIDNDDWRQTLDIALLGPVAFMKAVIPGMVERRFGRIVNIATGAAKFPAEIRLLSGPPRAALVNYTVAVARKVARHNVVINNVLPGMVHTEGIRDGFEALARRNGTTYEEETLRFAREWRIAAGRFGDADEVGAVVAMFCSAQAGFMVGQSLVVDGGIGNSTF
jgi:3-oxoacyl-[acyl-carrier protein] reductase